MAKKEVKKTLRQSVRQYEHDLAKNSKTHSKMFYNYINRKRVSRQGVPALQGSNLITDPTEIACHLNSTFADSFTTASTSALPDFPTLTNKVCPDPAITAKIVQTYLSSLCADKSIGVDGVHPLVLKSCSESLAIPLQKYFKGP